MSEISYELAHASRIARPNLRDLRLDRLEWAWNKAHPDFPLEVPIPADWAPPVDPPPPPPASTVFGAAVWSHATDWAPMLERLGVSDLEARRAYYTPDRPIPPSWDSVTAGGLYVDVSAGRSSLVTFRPPAGSVGRGEWDEELTSLFASKPRGILWWVGIGNEDERTGASPADRAADTIRTAEIRDASPNSDEIGITRVHMGYSFDVGTWDEAAWLPPEVCERLDFLTINHYQTLTGGRRTWHAIMGKTMAAASRLGVRVGLGEWGYPEDADNPSLKPAIVREVGAWCEEFDVPVACHYNTDQGFVSNDPRYLQHSSVLSLEAFREMFAPA